MKNILDIISEELKTGNKFEDLEMEFLDIAADCGISAEDAFLLFDKYKNSNIGTDIGDIRNFIESNKEAI